MQQGAHHLRARESKRSRRVRAMLCGSEWNRVQLFHLQCRLHSRFDSVEGISFSGDARCRHLKNQTTSHVLDNRHGSPDSVNAPDMKMMRRQQSFLCGRSSSTHLCRLVLLALNCQPPDPGERFELATSLFAHGGSLWLILRCTRGPQVYGSF
jgi:hypothetical protein